MKLWSNENVEFPGKTNHVSAPTLYGIWPRLNSNIKMQIKDLHLVICVLVHFVKSWSRRCAVTQDTIRGHLDTFYLRSSGAHLHSVPSQACLRGRSLAKNPLSIVIATMIHNDGPRDCAKRRDSSTIRDDESANVPSSGAPLESGHADVNICLWTWKLFK